MNDSTPQNPPAAATFSALPGAALQSLDTARAELVRYEAEIAAQLSAAQAQIDEAAALKPQLAALHAHAAQLREGHAELGRNCQELGRDNETLRADADALRTQTAKARGEADALKAQLAAQNAQIEAQHQQAEAEKARADAHAARAAKLQHALIEMHNDLVATDVHTLILRAAITLTGAEQGLFTDESGERVIATIGLDDLSPEVSAALFQFTKQALRDEAPIVRNDSENLPDHTQCVNIAVLPVAVQNEARGAILVANKRSAPFDEDDTQVLLSIGRHAGIALENRRLHAALEDAYRSTIAVLADAIEAKDPFTRGHCESVSRLAVAVAEALGCKGDDLEHVRYAALLHDVGKIGVSDGVLLKPGKLLPEEFGIIQKHAAIGADLANRVPALARVVPLILHHHERMDGSGYPEGLEGEAIPLGARIIGAVDAFDAMTTPRPYRNPVSPQEALEELARCAGSQFDLDVVQTLTRVFDETRDVRTHPVEASAAFAH